MIALFVAFNGFTRRREALLAYCAAPGMSYDGHGEGRGEMKRGEADAIHLSQIVDKYGVPSAVPALPSV